MTVADCCNLVFKNLFNCEFNIFVSSQFTRSTLTKFSKPCSYCLSLLSTEDFPHFSVSILDLWLVATPAADADDIIGNHIDMFPILHGCEHVTREKIATRFWRQQVPRLAPKII